ncbi:undecaprenyl-diphosphate phosphatase [Desertibacillus haloalkaliphilus]|uniref:undecaprenyl-diphosphate phosphatase n=1 Tax=Desertibacillus haloalkaliphilus TaxID=1328930 RepID=UPI001C25CDA2|nr:undecaprenyl-diphosphate phosphatase [Desertibacillus haloalkaliphilus]MBU8905712.1 undecaprenyl-diphosphate phosphatase [Desertibacillus haloalkaliphilus]
MTWFEALIIGIIQGLSEFLPISSSAHLILTEKLLGIEAKNEPLVFEVFLHFASLLAVICFFWRDVVAITKDFFTYLRKKSNAHYSNYRFGWFIILATIVTMVVGKGIEEIVDDRITNTATIGASLIVTGIFLILIEHGISPGTRTVKNMTWKDGIIVGIGQALAVIPGISRAGSTLIVALWSGLAKETAVRYSFLLSIPVIAGITVLKLPELSNFFHNGMWVEVSIAFAASFAFAIVGIKWLMAMLTNAKLTYFAFYCIVAGIFVWIFLRDTPVLPS